MKWKLAIPELDDDFGWNLDTAVGTIWTPRTELYLVDLFEPIPEDEEEREYLELDGPQEFFDEELFGGIGAPPKKESMIRSMFRPGVYFSWEGIMGWGAALRFFDPGTDAVFAIYSGENAARRVVAALQPKDSPELYSEFFEDFIASNGGNYSVSVFGGPPSLIENAIEHLIPRAVVRHSIYRWMEEIGYIGWGDLSGELDSGEFSSGDEYEWDDEEDEEEEDISEKEKQQILDAYMKRCYRELDA